jgi:hypothetical protein
MAIKTVGTVVAVVGIVLAVVGVVGLVDVMGQPMDAGSARIGVLGDKEARMAAQVAQILWGLHILTAGRYLYRAAGRQGARDRLGRLLLIAGYAVVIFGMAQAVRAGMAESMGGFVGNLVGFGVPGALAVAAGASLSAEDPLLMVNFSVSTRTEG